MLYPGLVVSRCLFMKLCLRLSRRGLGFGWCIFKRIWSLLLWLFLIFDFSWGEAWEWVRYMTWRCLFWLLSQWLAWDCHSRRGWKWHLSWLVLVWIWVGSYRLYEGCINRAGWGCSCSWLKYTSGLLHLYKLESTFETETAQMVENYHYFCGWLLSHYLALQVAFIHAHYQRYSCTLYQHSLGHRQFLNCVLPYSWPDLIFMYLSLPF